MAFSRRELRPDEQVLLDLHPHWRRLVRPFLAAPLIVGLASFGLAAMPAGRLQSPARWAVAVAGLLALLVFCVRPWLRWRATRYLVTDWRVVYRAGVLVRRGRDIPVARITDVSFRRSLLERIVGTGTLVVDSGGEGGRIALRDVPGVADVAAAIQGLITPAPPVAAERSNRI